MSPRFMAESLGPEVVVEDLGEPPSPAADVLARIDRVWQQERAERGDAVFDAPLFSLAGREGNHLRGHFVPYRWWLAQSRDPDLAKLLEVRPLAVCAVTCVDDGVVFGRRSDRVFQDPGLWEPGPAGGLQAESRSGAGRVSPEAQLLSELEEELGISGDRVASATPFALVYDDELGVRDIVYELRVDLAWDAVRAAFDAAGSGEYCDLCWVARDALAAFLASDAVIAPISRILLEARGWVESR